MKDLCRVILLALLLTVNPLSANEEQKQPSSAQLSLDDLRTFTDVFNQVRNHFVEETDDRELLNAAIRGMLSELDPHSSYMEADEFRQLDNDSRGRYSGIGVEVNVRDHEAVIASVFDAGAADKAGVVAGDIITSIDQQDLRRHNLQTAIDHLRGEAGTGVEVTFKHQNGEVSTLTLIRDYVDVASVKSRSLDGDYGYFRITHFTRKSADELAAQIDAMKTEQKRPLKGIILDLRDNPGGVLRPAVTIADGFLNDGLIVYTRGRSEHQLEYTASPGQWFQGIPVVVMVNGASASASEVLAGALQDHGRALIVGEKTFGKGSIQSVLSLRNGSGIRLTTSRYFTPSGRSIQAEGIQPDVEIATVEVIQSDGMRASEADLDGHLKRGSESGSAVFDSEVNAADDYMLYQALILLKGSNVLSANGG
jgi:carboxyl-terminal processing protease